MRLSAPGWSDWHALTSDGQISPSLLPCSAFQLAYFMQFQADSRFLSSGSATSAWNARWEWAIANNQTDRDLKQNWVFDQTVDGKIQLIYQKLGGWTKYTWYWDDTACRVYTEVPQPVYMVGGTQGGYPVEVDAQHPDGWQQVSAERGYADPMSNADSSEEAGYTDYEVYVDTWYYSAAYEVNLNPGSYLGIPFHNCGAYVGGFVRGNLYDENAINRPTVDAVKAVVTYGNIHIRTKGGSLDAVRCPRQGVAWVPSVDGSGIEVASLSGKQTGPFHGTVAGAQAPFKLFRFPASTRLGLLSTNAAQGVRYYESSREGQEGSWQVMGIIRLNGAAVSQYTTACLSEDGGMIYMLVPAGTGLGMLHVPLTPRQDETGGYDAVDIGGVSGLPTVPDGTYMVSQRGRLHMVLRGTNGAEYYYSTDGGKVWQ